MKSTLEFGNVLKEFMGRESLCVIREIAGKSIDHKLVIADFFVRAFALIGDIEVHLSEILGIYVLNFILLVKYCNGSTSLTIMRVIETALCTCNLA